MSSKFDANLVTTLVRSLARADKAVAEHLQSVLLSIRDLDDVVASADAFEAAGVGYVNRGDWDHRTLIVRKSNFRKVAEAVVTHPEFRKAVEAQPIPLQRAYMMACSLDRGDDDAEQTVRYNVMRFQRQLQTTMRWAQKAGFSEAVKALDQIARAVEKSAQQAGYTEAEEYTQEPPRAVRRRA